jgi:hypothetical protein
VSDLNGGEKTLMQLFNSFWYTVQGKSQLLLQRRLTRFLALHCQDICRLNLLGYVAQKAELWIRIKSMRIRISIFPNFGSGSSSESRFLMTKIELNLQL